MNEEIKAAMGRYLKQSESSKNAIVAYARGLVPVLLDAGRGASADELKRLLFMLDANEQEMTAKISQDPEAFFQALLEQLGR